MLYSYFYFILENLQNLTEDDSMKVLFDNDSQDWDDGNNNYKTRDISTNTTNFNLTESSTQTNTTDNSKYIEMANESFGIFIGRELLNVPMFKRRFVMHQIIRLIENNS